LICSQNINDHLLLHYSFDGNFNGESVHVNNGNNHGATFTEDRFVNPHSACYIKGIDNTLNFQIFANRSQIYLFLWRFGLNTEVIPIWIGRFGNFV